MKKILYRGSCDEISMKKSRFIGTSIPVTSSQEAMEIINEFKKKYWDATHNCYAYRINENEKKCSDDGEPSKTAGYPILDVIDNNKIDNCLIIVTRYFGGTLLGTGGLVKAYTEGANAALKNAKVIEIYNGINVDINCNYEEYGSLNYILNDNNIFINNTEFTDIIKMNLYIYDYQRENIEKKIQNILRKVEPFTNSREVKMALLDGEMLEFE